LVIVDYKNINYQLHGVPTVQLQLQKCTITNYYKPGHYKLPL